ECKTRCAVTACPPAAVRGLSGAHVAAGSAVVRVVIHEGARPVAVEGARGAVVNARSGNTIDNLSRKRCGTRGAASSAVEDVSGQIRAIVAAACLPQGPAVVSAGPAVRIRLQVAADPLARRDRATGVAAARSGEATGVAVARLAGREALILLFGIAALAESFARIGPLRPRRFQPQRAQ